MSKVEFILDAAQRSFHGDDAFYARDLVNTTLSKIYEKEYPKLGWLHGGLLQINQEADPGALTYNHLTMGDVGLADIVSPRSTDLPEVDVEGDSTPRKIVTVACSFSYSTQDLRQSTMMSRGGVNLDIAGRKANAARGGHDRRINQLLAFGDGAHGLYGVTNHPGIFAPPAITGNWLTATSAQIYADFDAAYGLMLDGTNDVEVPDTCVVDGRIIARLRGLTWDQGNSSNVSTLQYLEDSFEVKFHAERTMATASASNGRAMLMYNRDPEKLYGVMPMALVPQTAHQHGLVFSVALESRFGGVTSPAPRSILRLDGI